MANGTCAILQVLRDMGLPDDLATKIRMERAVVTIQGFFRRSRFRVEVNANCRRVVHYPHPEIPRPGRVHWNPMHTQHGSANFLQDASWRHIGWRYKPLGIVLKAMMKEIIKCKKTVLEDKQRFPKRKKLFWNVTLMRRSKFVGDVPIITVDERTKFH